jgi:tRNA(Ile)-lysidine synthetase-like protein
VIDDLPQILARSLARAEITHHDRVLVAFSGGLDSTVLVDLLDRSRRKGGPDLELIHIDHGVREGSDSDARHCVERSRELGLAFHCETLRWSEGAPRGQTALRRRRLAALAIHARRRGIAWILTAHHGDDRIETALLNLLRGTGLRGLTSLRECAPFPFPQTALHLLRPLISVRKQALHAYAMHHELSWITDPTNTETRYERNRLRLEVIPGLLAGSDPERLLQNLHLLEREAHVIDRACEDLRRLAVLPGGTSRRFELSTPPLLRADPTLVTRLFLTVAPGLDAESARTLWQALSHSRPHRLTLKGWLATLTEDDRLMLQAYHRRGASDLLQDEPEPIALRPLAKGSAPFFDFQLTWELVDSCSPTSDAFTLALRPDVVPQHLRIGPPRGEKIRKRGPDGPFRQPIAQVLSDLGIPTDRRRRWPCLFDATGAPIWIAGARIAPPPPLQLAGAQRPAWLLRVRPRHLFHPDGPEGDVTEIFHL